MRFWTVLFVFFALVCGVAQAQPFTASPASLAITAGQGQPSIPSQDITVNNPGLSAPYTVSLNPGVTWATVQAIAPSSTLPATSSISAVRVQFAAQNLAAGSHSTNVILASPGRPTLTIPVNLQVTATLYAQPKEVSFSGAPGSAASNPPSLRITVSNFGEATNYLINRSPSAPWLRVSKTSGSLPQNGSDTFDINTDATGLTSTGEVVGTIEITAPSRPSDIVTVRLNLSGAQDITLSPATLTFAGQAGTATSAPNQATVTISWW